MALRTPSQYDDEKSYGSPDNVPSGDPSDPRVYKPSETRGVYDDKKPAGTSSDPRSSYDPQKTALGDSTDPRQKKWSNEAIEDRENRTSSPSTFGSEEKNQLGQHSPEGGWWTGNDKSSRFSRLRGKVTRKRIAGIAAIGVIGGIGFAGFGILQGPLQFIHLAQNLQKHFKSNDDFGNERTSKILLYALADKGAQNGRLGITGNYAANKWEKRLLDQTGLRPVYQEGSRRFVGFEIVNDNRAQDFLGDVGGEDSRNSAALERVMGNGAEISRGEAGIIRPDGGRLDSDRNFVDLRSVSFGDRRVFIRTIGRSTSTHNVASSIGSRVLIKRAGVTFHPLNKLEKRTDEAIAKLLEKRRSNIQDGVQANEGLRAANTEGDDGNGNPTQPAAADQAASGETKTYIEDFKKSGAFKTAGSAAIAVGVLCAAKSYGNGVEDYKYQNNVLPMIRTGTYTVASGSQVMSGNDFNLGSLGVMTRFLYDKESGTSWTQAESIRAEQGKSGGVPIPKEAELKNATAKPKFFEVIDSIPALGTACDAQEGFFGLPIIKDVVGVASSLTQQLTNAVLSLGGTDTDALLESSLKAVSGRSVDPDAKGADFGNFANTGTFLAANEQSMAAGGRSLTDGERTNLALYESSFEKQEYASRSIAERYLDPFNSRSLVAAAIDASPAAPTQGIETLSNPVNTIASGISNLFGNMSKKAVAASNYDYGVPKIGFALSERADGLYENPYENALRKDNKGKTLEDDLPRLSEEYGKKCFGVEVSVDDNGVHLTQSTEKVNVFKVYKEHPECDATKNRDDRFNQFRFYLADATTALSLACYEGSAEACAEIGADAGPPNDSDDAQAGELIDSGDLKIRKLKNPMAAAGTIDPKGITLHWWGSQGGQGIQPLVRALRSNTTCGPRGCSVQLGITSDGEVWQLTENLTDRTLHAIGANDTTIGIEIEGGPDEFGKEGLDKYPKKFEAVVKTVQYLKDKYGITLSREVGCGSDAKGIHPHKAYNICGNSKSDIDDYYFNEVMKHIK